MKQFWVRITADQEITNMQQVKDICEEIEGNVSHVISVTPAETTHLPEN